MKPTVGDGCHNCGFPDGDLMCEHEEERYNQRMETTAWEEDD